MKSSCIALALALASSGCLQPVSRFAPQDVQDRCAVDLTWDKVSGAVEIGFGGAGSIVGATAPLIFKDFNTISKVIVISSIIGGAGALTGTFWSKVNANTYIADGCAKEYGPPPFDVTKPTASGVEKMWLVKSPKGDGSWWLFIDGKAGTVAGSDTPKQSVDDYFMGPRQ